MQLSVAAFFVLEAVFSIVTSAIFINHDSILRVMQAQGTQIPQGTDINTLISVSIFIAWAVVVVIAALELLGALGSYMGWRWVFWVVLVLNGFGAIGAITNLRSFSNPSLSALPTWSIAVSELFSIASAALFVWMLVGVIRYGPWAMKRPGA